MSQSMDEQTPQRIYGGCEGPDAMYVKLISSDGHEFIGKYDIYRYVQYRISIINISFIWNEMLRMNGQISHAFGNRFWIFGADDEWYKTKMHTKIYLLSHFQLLYLIWFIFCSFFSPFLLILVTIGSNVHDEIVVGIDNGLRIMCIITPARVFIIIYNTK